ncbi:alpha/beta-hydrolase [Epithele typhae]|uniref:alpha/beta-hydrolase n=1 Tax=Epithele typhae TaxID=378194 RepID=UPI002008D088|nr:alpha/beta-hydrolase [Epithele typhae]KAH9921553.1 alpha/beta-hydrolase [Epithele typhae]
MLSNWDKYGRFSLDLASAATAACTKLGFSVTRGIASTAAGFTGTVVDYALFGGTTGAGEIFGVRCPCPILLGESITSTSLIAAHSSLSILTTIFPGSDEASFSLTSFVGLRALPEQRFGVTEVLRALAGFAALQGVTSHWQEKRWFKYMKEVPRLSTRRHTRPSASMDDLKQTLRRLSKLVLAGYGGPSLLFFGVSLSPWEKVQQKEEVKIADAIDASEKEAAGETARGAPQIRTGLVHDHDIFLNWAKSHSSTPQASPESAPHPPPTAHVSSESHMPRFWVLTDHVRQEVVLLAVDLTCDPTPFVLPNDQPPPRPAPIHTLIHDRNNTRSSYDHTWNFPFPMDLSVPFPTTPSAPRSRRNSARSGSSTPLPRSRVLSESIDDNVHLVHGGMIRMTRAMGSPGKPVHVAVREALRRNKGYSLVLCGHSLGAGVAALLALMWASTETCLTQRSSGLPVNRRVSAYCFAPPCAVSPRLSAKAAASGLIMSFVYGHDIVSRLSLGSVRDLTRGAAWLCAAENREGSEEGYSTLTKRAFKWKIGRGEEGDEEWFLAVRKTLEANMQMADLFPPGRVFWALRDGDLHRSHRIGAGTGRSSPKDKVRLFEVLDIEHVFGQIIFARDMLSAHLPHQYDQVLHELL